VKFTFNFYKGACVEYIGNITDPPAMVEFINGKTNDVVYKTILNPNMWSKTTLEYFIEWELKVSIDAAIKFNHKLDLSNKRVILVFPYRTLGDFLLWLPVFERFRLKHNCLLIVHCEKTSFIDTVHKSYPNIIFTHNYGALINEGLYAIYEPMLSTYDMYFTKGYPKFNTSQQAATELLGMEYEPIIPRIDSTDERPDIDGKYICITEFGSTNIEKIWIYPNGYKTVADYMVSKGYKVLTISAEPSNISGEGIIDKTGCGLKEMIQYIKYSDMLLGGATGPMIAGLALGIPTIQISTNTWPDKSLPLHYVYNHTEGTCFGCYTKEPKNDNVKCTNKSPVPWISSHAFVPECSWNITPDMVIDKINEVMSL